MSDPQMYQRLGELLAAAGEVREDVREVREDVRSIRHSQANVGQQVVGLTLRVDQLDKRLGRLEPAFEEVQQAKATFLALRRGALLAAAPLAGIAGWFSGPLRTWLAAHAAAWLSLTP